MKEKKTPQNIEQYQKHYSEKGLFSKIGKVCKKAGMKAVYYVLLLYYVLMDEKTSWEHKGIIIGTLGYFILPIDLIPDFIPAAGYTDDITALVTCIKTVMNNVTPDIKRKAAQKLTDWFTGVKYSKMEEYDADLEG